MRGFDCPGDGHHHDGENDEQLFAEVRKHANEVHPGAFSDEQVRGFIASGAYECQQHANA